LRVQQIRIISVLLARLSRIFIFGKLQLLETSKLPMICARQSFIRRMVPFTIEEGESKFAACVDWTKRAASAKALCAEAELTGPPPSSGLLTMFHGLEGDGMMMKKLGFPR
jgi:hypothetical protein